MTTTNELREMFLDYFTERQHAKVASSPIVPPDDPSMLFTSAGMVQFKSLYAGLVDPLPYTRATTVQKCLRAGGKGSDLENVGKTLRHHTFFEMLGNFSFGDYFKHEALEWGWDFILNHMKLPKDRLWATYYKDAENEDLETSEILENEIGIPRDRIIGLDAKENFWGPAGETGACGPCSEVCFFMGTDAELEEAKTQDRDTIARRIVDEGDTFLEIWNMVFPQFDQQKDGSRPALKNRGIDTGAGLERMTTVMQFMESGYKIRSPYETDLLQPIVQAAASYLGTEWAKDVSHEVLEVVKYLERHYKTREHAESLRKIAQKVQAHKTGKNRRVSPKNIITGIKIKPLVEGSVDEAILTKINHVIGEGFYSWGLTQESLRPAYAANVVADHIRALTFSLSEGIVPSNEKQGSVLRRILRRALRFASLTSVQTSADDMRDIDPFLFNLVDPVVETMKDVYPELILMTDHIKKIIRSEEESFLRTMRNGEKRLRVLITEAKHTKNIIPGRDLFSLEETLGYHVEMTKEVVEEYNAQFEDESDSRRVTLDMNGYREAREKAREKSKSANGILTASVQLEGTAVGIRKNRFDRDNPEIQTEIMFLFPGGEGMESGRALEKIEAGSKAIIIIDKTPFYSEAGGQVGDTGTIRTSTGAVFTVLDSKDQEGFNLLIGEVKEGTFSKGEAVTASIDAERRMAITRNHTVTHLLQTALRMTVDKHIRQSGSYVGPEGMRFDFSNPQACSGEELAKVERIVNEMILKDCPVDVEEMPIDEARKRGAIAPFGEKYGHQVRVVDIVGTESMEFCGGTHLKRTGRIGSFRIVTEGSVASGTRRIEGVTGAGAYERWAATRDVAEGLCHSLAVKETELAERVETFQGEIKKMKKEIKKLKTSGGGAGGGKAAVADLLASAKEVDGIKIITAAVPEADAGQLRSIADQIRDKAPASVAVLGSSANGKVLLVCAVTKAETKRIKAGDVIKQIAPIVGGGGGGRPDFAQAGGKQPEKLDEAIAKAGEIVAGMLE